MAASKSGGGSKGGGGGSKSGGAKPPPKAPPKQVHTVPKSGGGWANKQSGEVTSEHRKKDPAVAEGRKQAIEGGLEHKIHVKKGQITESNSYGNDPNPPKDKK